MQRLGDFGRSVPPPKKKKDNKNIVVLGSKTYVFMSSEEAKDFMHLVRIKHVYADEAYQHIVQLRKEGHYGDQEESEAGSSSDDKGNSDSHMTDEHLFG